MAAALFGGAVLSGFPDGNIWDWFKTPNSNGKELLRKLKSSPIFLNRVLDDAENKEITDPYVKSWLDDLKDFVFDAEDLLAYDSHAKAREFEQKLEEIHERLAHLTEEWENLRLGGCGREADMYGHNLPLERRATSLVYHSEVEDREADTEAITKLLMSDETNGVNGLGVIAIVGMGGLGKTTLAQLVYCQKEVSEKFQLKAWICVSEETDVFLVTKNILKGFAPGVPNIDSMTPDLLQTSLRDALTGKRFLLVLDDVWNESSESWKNLLKPLKHGLQGSRIIVTTRSNKVASIASTVRAYYLKELTEDECWLVFARCAFRDEEPTAYSDLERIGRKLAAKCRGLPLAANALGSLLSEKRDAIEWERILRSEIWYLEDCGILPALRLSYRYLPSSHKRCFAYCALFPKDYEFKIHELVRLWMADGIFYSRIGNKPMEETGVDCFYALLSRSFFEKSRVTPGCFVMHDLIHDLAKYVAGDFFYLKERDNACLMPERTRHLSYLFDAPFEKSKSLRTFLPIRTSRWYKYEKTAVHHLLETSKCLRVLSLANHYSMKEVPESIGNLKLLRYLDLSWTSIKRLPDVVFKLCYLETLLLEGCGELEEVPDSIVDLKLLHFLNLSGTTINKLPTDLCNLVNLCFLDIRNTKLQGMPPELGKLTRLQKLEDFFVGKGSSWSSIEELKDLSKLTKILRIWNLQNIVNAQDASGSNLKGKKHLNVLELSWEGDDADDLQHELRVVEGLEPPCTLEHLTMRGYRSTKFPYWVSHRSFSKLVSLRIEGCKNCCEMPPLGHVDSLTSLYVSGCDSILVVGPSFYGSPLPANDKPTFKSLKVLHFKGMSEWITWERHDGAFPSLEELCLSECPKLESALPGALPSLKELKIEGCDQLVAPFPRARAIVKVTVKDKNHEVNLDLESDVLSLCLSGINSSSIDQLLGDIRRTLGERIADLKRLSFFNCDLASGYQGTHSCSQLGGVLEHFKWLNTLEIRACSLTFDEVTLPSTITFLKLIGMEMKSLDGWGLQRLTSLEELRILSCDNIESITTREEPLPSSLRVIELEYCPRLRSIQRGEAIPSSLQSLHIVGCPLLEEKYQNFYCGAAEGVELTITDEATRVGQLHQVDGPLVSCNYSPTHNSQLIVSSSGNTLNAMSANFPPCLYQVFVSFRGGDTRAGFVSHLYSKLITKGIFAFMDDRELRRGKSISLEVIEAIRASRIAIVVLSEKYATSSWCLDELVEISNCRAKMEQIVIPVFYKVDPSDVQYQRKRFASAFEEHKRNSGVDGKKHKAWRDALAQVALLSGWHFKDGEEASFIDRVVADVSEKVSCAGSIDASDLVGMDYPVREMERMLSVESNVVRFVGVLGKGGSGKTTIARVVYDKVCRKFAASWFLENVGSKFRKHGAAAVKKELLANLLKETDLKGWHLDEHSTIIKERLGKRDVLIVLDNVDHVKQLEVLAKSADWFGTRSKIIITTRDKKVLDNHGVKFIYEIKNLDNNAALQLFSIYAFQQNHPRDDFYEMSHDFVTYAEGLPLALKVLGSSLYNRDERQWQEQLLMLRRCENRDLFNVLRLSFDQLKENEKEVFLDIACFFNGEDKARVGDIFYACGFSPENTFEVLKEKALLNVLHNNLYIDQLLCDMAVQIIQQKSKLFGEHSRLWDPKHINDVLSQCLGTESVEGIFLETSPSESKEMQLSDEAFSGLINLRLLKINNRTDSQNRYSLQLLDQGFKYFPDKLRYLHWYGFPSKKLVPSFSAENLVELELPYSDIEQLWDGKQALGNLKLIDLSHSQLIELPDLSEAKRLEVLQLSGCEKLVEVHSIQHLMQLEKLDLSNCSNLRKLSELPTSITHLNLEGTAIEKLPESLGSLTDCERLDLRNCSRLQRLPRSIIKMGSLNSCDISGSPSLLMKLSSMKCSSNIINPFKVDSTSRRPVPGSVSRPSALSLSEKIVPSESGTRNAGKTPIGAEEDETRLHKPMLTIPSSRYFMSPARLEMGQQLCEKASQMSELLGKIVADEKRFHMSALHLKLKHEKDQRAIVEDALKVEKERRLLVESEVSILKERNGKLESRALSAEAESTRKNLELGQASEQVRRAEAKLDLMQEEFNRLRTSLQNAKADGVNEYLSSVEFADYRDSALYEASKKGFNECRILTRLTFPKADMSRITFQAFHDADPVQQRQAAYEMRSFCSDFNYDEEELEEM